MQAATAAGFSARSAGGDVEDLIALILKEKPGGLLLHLSGTHTRGDVAGRLQAAGLHCTNVAVYEQVDQPPTPAFLAAMAGEAPLVVPLFSARSAGALAGLRPKGACHVIAMSQAVADAVVVDDRILTTCAPVPTEAAMIATTIKTLEMLEQVAQ
jgi:uroporphyrinogen-III synthase